ncbi:tetratricopeptide repeat protein [Maricaulaceae bacterium EIL42A08]|nr:tetratricopeptide repeat protein [Maricaulaceae bacterium EIL42A08]
MMSVIAISALIALAAGVYVATPVARDGARVAGLVIAGLIALGAFGAYLVNGEPDLSGQPYDVLIERLRSTEPTQLTPIEQEERLRDAIRNNPEDIRALTLLGRFLARTDRELEAIGLLQRALRQGEDARIYSDLGEALVNLNEGQVTAEARRAFRRAYELDPNIPEPSFFLGSAAYAEGDRAMAATYWTDIINRLPTDDPYRAAIADRAADLLSRPTGGPGADGEAPFANAEPGDIEAMISAMVDRLEMRLDDDPGDLSGWLTLARARMMMEKPAEAREALETARSRFEGQPGKLALISALESAFAFEETDA